uniref:aspartate transaminase n=1 Tax=Helicotheca tamesis TaxID=374047 RepID=A0A7S2MEE3_9STRA|mmetsp:Transcript_1455/g.2084  ORF Transcript_1455/g.2084 Transcript_1455/m.2084 type:complete len:472 (+) Transcript_1455:112-1527(+)|eukprot:CAMPEP_0185725816 /NCGR_PEP_ID=MMETSP1171-20130828/1976_1 /TAXON_ID=374046 /ORGANISM="Helicotheca tamensis, Strain CCMP826" /LENGTH=471 /DNA_ID=CAMNT_0028394035 /DNA_START=37 /DNA_END=1452 /DNA_ORIENTATION=+
MQLSALFLVIVAELSLSTTAFSLAWNRRALHFRGGDVSSSSTTSLRQSSASAEAETPTTSSAGAYLSTVPAGPPDAILGIAEAFKKCTDPRKVNVCVGAYRDEAGKPWVLPSVREAERRMLDDPATNKEYASIIGDAEFVNLALKFAYGADADMSKLAGVQSLSGTGACRIGGHFFSKFLPDEEKPIIYIPTPTWGNHIAIFRECGLEVRRYRYYDSSTNGLDYDGMVQDLKDAPDGSIILLHACAHNPTGCDPTLQQWKDISDMMKEKSHHVFFDSAYQGFASGDAEHDAEALRLFVKEGHTVALAQSFAKNFGLYGERCGTFSLLCNNADEREKVMSQLKLIIRPMYSSPPIHGSSIVRTVLTDDELRGQYYEECSHMAGRIKQMRLLLVEKLKEAGSVHDWSHVTNQIGMFAFTGMNSDMCDELTSEYAIFLTRDGRISLAGLNDNNVEYVAKAIHSVTDGKSITTSS